MWFKGNFSYYPEEDIHKMTNYASLWVSIYVKRHHDDHSNSYKKKSLIGAVLHFRGLFLCCHGRKYRGMMEEG